MTELRSSLDGPRRVGGRREKLQYFTTTMMTRALCLAWLWLPWLSHARQLIIGGQEVGLEDFPFLVRLFDESFRHQCGGTWIREEEGLVLTAAHCVASTKFLRHGNQTYRVLRSRTHPQYFDHPYVAGVDVDPYDVAVLQVYGPVVGDPDPVVLAETDELSSGDSLTVAGWGITNASQPSIPSSVLRATTLSYLSNAECIAIDGYEDQIIDVSLCAEGVNGSDACLGDSGSPLLDAAGQQVGIHSASFGCGVSPSLNVRISVVYDWIQDVVDSWLVPASSRCVDGLENLTVSFTVEIQAYGWALYQLEEGERRAFIDGRPIQDTPLVHTETYAVPYNHLYAINIFGVNDGLGMVANMTVTHGDMVLVNETEIVFGDTTSIEFPFGDDRHQATPTSAPVKGAVPFLTIVLALDDFPTEVGYLVDVWRNGEYELMEAVYPGTFTEVNATVERTVRLDPDETKYRITMTDNEHDGYSYGSYRVYLGPAEEDFLLVEGGDFFLEDVYEFELDGSEPRLKGKSSANEIGAGLVALVVFSLAPMILG